MGGSESGPAAGESVGGALARLAVPPCVETAWGLRERQGRGPRPVLSLQGIVGAAIRVTEKEGLAALTMSRIAAELRSAPMSLYRHVGSKDELLTLMVDAGVGVPPPGPDAAQGWRAGLLEWTSAAFDGYRQRPWIIRIPITGPPITPNQIRWLEWALQSLRDTGLTAQEKLSTVLLLSAYARTQATISADIAEAAQTGIDPSAVAAGYGQTLARLIDPERFPAVQAAIASGGLDDEPDRAGGSHEDQFVGEELRFGLDRILDGVEVLIRGRQDR